MKVTKAMMKSAKEINDLQSTTYHVGTTDAASVIDGKRIGIYHSLADFPVNKFGQTPRDVYSFTVSLAQLLSIDTERPFVTAISEEAAGYISEHALEDYRRYLATAADFNNLERPEGLKDIDVQLPEDPTPREHVNDALLDSPFGIQ